MVPIASIASSLSARKTSVHIKLYIYTGTYTQYAMGEVHRPCSRSASIFNPNCHGCTHYTRRREKIRIYHAQLFPIKKSCARQTNGASLAHDITIIRSFSDFVCSYSGDPLLTLPSQTTRGLKSEITLWSVARASHLEARVFEQRTLTNAGYVRNRLYCCFR